MNFQSILNNIEQSVIDLRYSHDTINKWIRIYRDEWENWEGQVKSVHELASFLKAVIGIDNDTENLVILTATQLALNKQEEDDTWQRCFEKAEFEWTCGGYED